MEDNNILKGSIFSKLFLYSIPIILSGWVQLLYNAADIIVVGRYSGSEALGAVGATSSLSHLLVNLFIALSSGSAVCVAQAIGAQRKDDVKKAVHTSFGIAIIGGILLAVVGVIFSKSMLLFLNTPPDIVDMSALYLKITTLGSVFLLVYNFGAAILRASGDTKTPLVFLIISGFVNVVLNLIFVIFCNMSVLGVALATLISQLLSAVLVAGFLMKKKDDCKLILKDIKIHKDVLLKILKIGLPASIQSVVFSISNVLVQSSVNSFGSAVVAGNSAASNIDDFCYTAMNAMHHSTVTYVGQNVGAKNMKRVKKIIFFALCQVVIIGVVTGGLILTFKRQLLNIYTPDNAGVIENGVIRLNYIVSSYCACGIMEVFVGALRGMGTSFIPMCGSILGVCGIRILWILTVFRHFHTLGSLFISYPISWLGTDIIHTVFTIIVFRKLKQKYQN